MKKSNLFLTILLLISIPVFYIIISNGIKSIDTSTKIQWFFLASNILLVLITIMYVVYTRDMLSTAIMKFNIEYIPILETKQDFVNSVTDTGGPIVLSFEILNKKKGEAINVKINIFFISNNKNINKLPLKIKTNRISEEQDSIHYNRIPNEDTHNFVDIQLPYNVASIMKTETINDIDNRLYSIYIKLRYNDLINKLHKCIIKIPIIYDVNDNNIKKDKSKNILTEYK